MNKKTKQKISKLLPGRTFKYTSKRIKPIVIPANRPKTQEQRDTEKFYKSKRKPSNGIGVGY